jgi:hypothetical protein
MWGIVSVTEIDFTVGQSETHRDLDVLGDAAVNVRL